jgi:hypothetical protein
MEKFKFSLRPNFETPFCKFHPKLNKMMERVENLNFGKYISGKTLPLFTSIKLKYYIDDNKTQTQQQLTWIQDSAANKHNFDSFYL